MEDGKTETGAGSVLKGFRMRKEKVQLNKVLMLRSVFAIGGAERHIVILSGELLDRGIGIEIGTAGGEGCSFSGMDRVKKIPIRLTPGTFRNLIFSSISLFKHVKRSEIQIIHSHQRFATLCAWFVSRILSVPLVSTEHGFFWERKFIVRLFQPDSFLTATEKVKRHLIEYYKIRPEKISVIPNATIVGENNRKNSKTKHEDSSMDTSINICYGGRLSEEKGLLVLLDSWEMIAREYSEAHLWIIGDGIMRPEMEKIISTRGLSGRTTVTGFKKNVSEFLLSMDMVVLPSFTENMPMILLEAMACSIPVIVTDVGGISELVENGEEGLLVKAGDCESLYNGMKTLIDNPELRTKMGLMGRKKVSERFNSKMMGDKHIKFYKEVMKQYSGTK